MYVVGWSAVFVACVAVVVAWAAAAGAAMAHRVTIGRSIVSLVCLMAEMSLRQVAFARQLVRCVTIWRQLRHYRADGPTGSERPMTDRVAVGGPHHVREIQRDVNGC